MSEAVEAKHCGKCSKKLNRNNSRGVCSKCANGRSAAAIATELGGGMPTSPKPRRARADSAGDLVARFRMAAEGLGMDPDEVLEEFCTQWLAKARKGVA